MKSKIILLISLSFLTISCSSDDSNGEDNGTPATSFPLTSNNFWTYDVHNHQTANSPEIFSRDSLYVANDTVIGSLTFKKMKTLAFANGFFTGTLQNNGLRIDGNKIRISGALSLSAGLPSSLSFSVSDFIILKENAPSGEELSVTNGSFTQDYNGIPLTFDYTLKSIADGSQNSLLSNGNTYSNITKTKVVLNLKITANVSGIQFNVMSAQDVLVSTQYYSKNVGMVYNNTSINYNLNTIPSQVQLPIPQSGSQTQEEFLDVYLIN